MKFAISEFAGLAQLAIVLAMSGAAGLVLALVAMRGRPKALSALVAGICNTLACAVAYCLALVGVVPVHGELATMGLKFAMPVVIGIAAAMDYRAYSRFKQTHNAVSGA